MNFDIPATASSPTISLETTQLHTSSSSPLRALICVTTSLLHSAQGLEPFVSKAECHPRVIISVV